MPSAGDADFVQLQGVVKHYDWGAAAHSIVGSIHSSLRPSQKSPSNLPYAEYWLGIHPSGPATTTDGRSLLHVCASRPLPFMLKVLSIATPLSIQVHPAAPHAARLHALHPALYPDPHAKAEIVMAVSDLDVLCGVHTHETAQLQSTNCPQIHSLVAAQSVPGAIAHILANRATFQNSLTQHIAALQALPTSSLTDADSLFLLFARVFPSDSAAYFAYLLRLHRLARGDAIVVSPGVPHAYIRGDALEVLTNSDNVIRAGLTSKHVDADAFAATVDTSTTPHVQSPSANCSVSGCGMRLFLLSARDLPKTITLSAPALAVCIAGSCSLTNASSTRHTAVLGSSFLLCGTSLALSDASDDFLIAVATED